MNDERIIPEMCGLPEYGEEGTQCTMQAEDIMEIKVDGTPLYVPICTFHAKTWMIMYGFKGIARLIGEHKIKYRMTYHV